MKTQEPTSVGGKKCHSVHSLHDGKVSTGSGFMPLCLFFSFFIFKLHYYYYHYYFESSSHFFLRCRSNSKITTDLPA